MRLHRRSLLMTTMVLVYLSGLALVANAMENQPGSNTGRVPSPVIPLGQGGQCVEDTGFMRRNHMDILQHQRDNTVQEGIRSKQHSLRECLDCHVVLDTNEVPVTVESPQHFCRSCHDYAAVKIDCFQCHASRPQTLRPGAAGLAVMQWPGQVK